MFLKSCLDTQKTQTSRHLASVTSLRNVWHQKLESEVLHRGLPVVYPSPSAKSDVSTYTAKELEQITIASVYHERRWQKAERVRSIELDTKSSFAYVSKFVGEPEGRYLLTIGFRRQMAHTCLKVFDLSNDLTEDSTSEHSTRNIIYFAEPGRFLSHCTYSARKGGDESATIEVIVAISVRPAALKSVVTSWHSLTSQSDIPIAQIQTYASSALS